MDKATYKMQLVLPYSSKELESVMAGAVLHLAAVTAAGAVRTYVL